MARAPRGGALPLTTGRVGPQIPRGVARTSASAAAEIESLLDQAATAYEAGRWAEVLELARRALKVEKRHPEALHFEASALAESGEVEAGLEAFRRALGQAPEDPQLMLGA